MSSEPSKVQVEFINEDKTCKVRSVKRKDTVLLCNGVDASGQRLVSIAQGEGGASVAPAVWGPPGHTQEVVTAS